MNLASFGYGGGKYRSNLPAWGYGGGTILSTPAVICIRDFTTGLVLSERASQVAVALTNPIIALVEHVASIATNDWSLSVFRHETGSVVLSSFVGSLDFATRGPTVELTTVEQIALAADANTVEVSTTGPTVTTRAIPEDEDVCS